MREGTVVWFTGLPCAGKTTLATALWRRATSMGYQVELLDGDILRTAAPGLGFSPEQRRAHLLRVAYTAGLLTKRGISVFCAFVSPNAKVRQEVRETVLTVSGGLAEWRLVYVQADIETCRHRDVKGLYAKAEAGEIKDFTGVSAPYEPPVDELDYLVNTDFLNVESSVACLVRKLGLISERCALFIGRWQPFHNGHKHIIDQALDAGERVCVAIRDTPINSGNPFSVENRVEMIRAVYNDGVRIVIIPDIKSVNIGRKVGYEVNRVDVPEDMGQVSATVIRELIQAGDERWQLSLPPPVAEWILGHPESIDRVVTGGE